MTPRAGVGRNSPLRLSYLDGLRAVAAVYVVLFHAVLGFSGAQSGAWKLLKLSLSFGHEAVAIFIVVSGYCLMLPVVRQPSAQLQGGFWRYLARRAYRILPPYYAALAGSLLLLATVPALRQLSGTIWDDSLPGLALEPVVSHVFLVHNWVPSLAYQINGPHWSVATEWQIYFFFPLLLLPLWRRHGALMTVLVAAGLGYAPLLLFERSELKAIPWYLCLFALGMLAAGVSFSERRTESWLRARVAWGKVSAALWLLCALGGTVGARVWFRYIPATDLLVGVAASCLLIYLTSRVQSGEETWLLRMLQSAPAALVGHFSYSLYLTHLPIVALCYFGLRDRVGSPAQLAQVMIACSLPTSLLVAYVFHRCFERYFMTPPAALRGRA